MSYAAYTPHVSQLVSLGMLGADVDVKGSLDASYSGAANSPNTQSGQSASDGLIGGASTAAEAKAYYDRYKRYIPPTSTKDFKDFNSAAKWGEKALWNYAKSEGKAWTADQINKVASNYGMQGCIPDHLPKNEAEAVHQLVDLGAAGACAAMGIDPRLGVVTADALYDGRIDTTDCKAIGAVAGAVAGAAACQAFGIPAPIGAFIGGKLGEFTGGVVADIFGLGDAAYEKWLKQQKKIVKQIEADAERQCYLMRKGYWDIFDKLIIETEAKWESLELSVNSKFDLRWFDETARMYEWIQQQYKSYSTYIDGPFCALRCGDIVLAQGNKPYITSHSDEQVRALMTKSSCPANASPEDFCAYACSFAFGCLYPHFPTWKKANTPTSTRIYGSSQRVIDAYMAHGVEWLPPASGPGMFGIKLPKPGERQVFCDYPSATSKEIKKAKYRKIWTDHLNDLLKLEQRRIKNLQTVQVRVLSDLIKTSATVAAQIKMVEVAAQQKKEQAAFIRRGAPKVIVDPGQTRKTVVNGGTLIGGASILGYGLWLL